jgi:hypothetical protein
MLQLSVLLESLQDPQLLQKVGDLTPRNYELRRRVSGFPKGITNYELCITAY